MNNSSSKRKDILGQTERILSQNNYSKKNVLVRETSLL